VASSAPAKDTGMSRETMTRLGLATALGVLGSQQAKKAAEEGQAGKRETHISFVNLYHGISP
jgi:hypothetical protein